MKDKLKVGTIVNVHAASGAHVKGAANGHICRISEVLVSTDSYAGPWKYKLEWRQVDNPGRKYPICINEYYYLHREIVVLYSKKGAFCMANSYPSTRKLEVGQKVIVKATNSKSQKSEAAGHVCTIKGVAKTVFISDSEYKYALGWSEKDNPGLVFPDCLYTNYFLDEEVIPLSLPNALLSKSHELPDV